MKNLICICTFFLSLSIQTKAQNEIHNMRRIPSFSNLVLGYESNQKVCLAYTYRLSPSTAFQLGTKIDLGRSEEVIVKEDTLEVMVNNRYLLNIGLSKKLFQIQDFIFIDGALSVYASYRGNGFTVEEVGIDYGFLKLDYGLQLAMEGTWYWHRFIALNAVMGIEKTLINLEYLRPFCRIGLQLNLNEG